MGEVIREMEGDRGKVVTSEIRGAAMKARAVIALYLYRGFLALSGGQSHARLRKG